MLFNDELIEAAIEQFGSPLYLVDEATLRQTFRAFHRSFETRWPTTIAWSYKTFPLNAVCRILHQEGAAAEVVSEYEWDLAQRVLLADTEVIVNGPAKTRRLLSLAVEAGAKIQLDGWQDLETLIEVVEQADREALVAVRVDLDAGASERWNRFGFDLESGEAWRAIERIANHSRLRLVGLHTHLGTCLTEPRLYASAAKQIAELVVRVEREYGIELEYVNLGGGFPAEGTNLSAPPQPPRFTPPIDDYAQAIVSALHETLGEDLRSAAKKPRLILEPGRALVDRGVSLLSTVQETRRTSTGEAMIVVDAGVHLLPALHWYPLEFHVSSRQAKHDQRPTRIVGPLCMNTDQLAKEAMLPSLPRGERIAIHPVGAYHRAQSWQFIAYRPATVLLTERGELERIERAESFDDWQSRMSMPEHLR